MVSSLQPRQNRRRKLKPVSFKGLHFGAMKYLERYAASKERLRQILQNRVRRSDAFHETETPEAAEWIEQILEEFEKKGYLNDLLYAQNRFRVGIESGKSKRWIVQSLWQKGICSEDIESAEVSLESESIYQDTERYAALQFIRKRRLGPYRPQEKREDFFQKDLGAFARAGFSFSLAKELLKERTVEDLEEETYHLKNPPESLNL